MNVAEMIILKWTSGEIREDNIRNKFMRGNIRVALTVKSLKNRL